MDGQADGRTTGLSATLLRGTQSPKLVILFLVRSGAAPRSSTLRQREDGSGLLDFAQNGCARALIKGMQTYYYAKSTTKRIR